MSALALRSSDVTALLDASSGEEVSYRELIARAAVTANTIGCDQSMLFLACRNDVFTATTYAAALEGGHAVALLDGGRPALDDVDLISYYRPRWLAGAPGRAAALAAAGIPVDEVMEADGGELIRTGYSTVPALHPDLALLMLTSGTTGSRRLVRLSAGNIAANAHAIAECLALSAAERPITSLPLHYSFGLSVLNSHLLVGATVVLSTESVVQGSFWSSVERYACSSLAGVPYTYQLLERVGYRDMDLPTVLSMQQAGGALDRRLTQLYARHMDEKGGHLFVMYGQTEATARISCVPPGQLLTKIDSAGVAIPGGHLRVAGDETGAPTGVHTGEVVYEGPNVMLGYATEPGDLARGDDLGGVLRTGDIGYLDNDGHLYLVGRSKRIAKVFGLRVNLDEIERILGEHGPVAVVGGDDALWAFCAFGSNDANAELGRALARRLRIHPSAVHTRRVTEIPTSDAGKIDYGAVQRWILS